LIAPSVNRIFSFFKFIVANVDQDVTAHLTPQKSGKMAVKVSILQTRKRNILFPIISKSTWALNFPEFFIDHTLHKIVAQNKNQLENYNQDC
jgi:hypothetical protein